MSASTCGLVLTILVNVLAMTAALYLMLWYLDVQALAVERRAWDAPATDAHLLIAILMISLEMALLTAVALFFSTFSSSALLSAAFTIGVYITGLFSTDLRNFGSIVDVSPLTGRFVGMVGWVVPAFSAFDIKAQIVHGVAIPRGFVAFTLLYAAFYIAAILAASITVFSRREFR